ncbi:SDR family NAD(P)-dependent oxidoreductase [Ramlibacter ginsenosidimutans]|nr:glucose 1-dehydrogenase [Ramlibacter ginsenosidimutans]
MSQEKSLMDAFRLDGRVAAITGGARGIGYATASLFTAAGARVVLLDLDEAAAREAAARLGAAASALRLDVSSEDDVTRAFDAVVASHGSIDVLVNNAGMALRRPTTELSLAEWQRVVDVNMTGVFLCARAAATHMLRAGGGAMVNTASIMGLSGGGLYPNISYQATKGAVVNMTRALAVEWAGRGVRVNAVAPTWVDTEFIGPLKADPALMERIRQMTPLGRLAHPNEVANAILFLASPASAMVTGHVLAVDGGFLAQ